MHPDQSALGHDHAVSQCPDLVRGDFVVQDQDGNELRTERRTVALCRCGKSRIRPLCDGTHKLIGFEAPSSPEPWPDA